MLRWFALLPFLVFVGACIVRIYSQPLPQEFIDAGVKLYIEQHRSREPIKLTENGQTGIYQYAQSSEELFDFYPNCCSFNTYDPEGPQLSLLTRWRYDVRGYVFIKAGRVKISGSGLDKIPPKDTIFILNGAFEDIYSRIF